MQTDFLSILNNSADLNFEKFIENIEDNNIASNSSRLDVYKRGYFNRIYEVLESDFPAIQAIVGHKKFDNLVREYLRRSPSQTESLANVGEHFSSFISNENIEHKDILQSLAEFEWKLSRLEYSDESILESICPSLLAGMNPETTQIVAAQKYKLRHFSWPISQIYEEEKILASREETSVLFLDRNRKPRFKSLTDVEKTIITISHDKANLDEVLEFISNRDEPNQYIVEFTNALSSLVENGLISIVDSQA